jgi:phospholipid/cholesterol/gamma-HCH transport system substrate-binding protein
MANKTRDTVRLGLFVALGVFLLIFALYMIGRNRNLFGSTFELRAHFRDVAGLVPGNNVQFSGINVGTVKGVDILSDTAIEVTMAVRRDMLGVLRRNTTASIGTEGLIGNKVVNLQAGPGTAPGVEPGDLLIAREALNTEEMLMTLDRTNRNVAFISEQLKQTVERINTSSQLAVLLNDVTLTDNLRASLVNLRRTTAEAEAIAQTVRLTVADVRAGRGSLGGLLRDTSLFVSLDQSAERLAQVAENAERLTANAKNLTANLDSLTARIDRDYADGSGAVPTLMRDSAMANTIKRALLNVESGTRAFDENMEALKSNFLTRGYFKKKEKKEKKELERLKQ